MTNKNENTQTVFIYKNSYCVSIKISFICFIGRTTFTMRAALFAKVNKEKCEENVGKKHLNVIFVENTRQHGYVKWTLKGSF